MNCTAALNAALAPPGSVMRRRRITDDPDPITLDHRLNADVALQILGSQGQAMAFVTFGWGRSGVVTAELRFAREWAGPGATLADAVTQEVIDLEPDHRTPGTGRNASTRP